MTVARPMISARRRALPDDACSKLGLAPVGETMFPPRAPFFQRPSLMGEPPGSPRPLPAHRPETGR